MKINSKKQPVTIHSTDVLMSPGKVTQRMSNIFQKYGPERAAKSVSFQKAREAWVASVFLLGLSQINKKTYWIQENKVPQEDPDVFGVNYRNREDGKRGVVKEIQPIEIFEYPPEAKLGLSEHIVKKLKNKAYHPETIAICYLRRDNFKLDILEVITELMLQDNFTSVRELWLLATYDTPETRTNFKIARIYMRGEVFPAFGLAYSGDYIELCKIAQPDFLRDSRGSQAKVGFSPSGDLAIVPLPNDHIKKK